MDREIISFIYLQIFIRKYRMYLDLMSNSFKTS